MKVGLPSGPKSLLAINFNPSRVAQRCVSGAGPTIVYSLAKRASVWAKNLVHSKREEQPHNPLGLMSQSLRRFRFHPCSEPHSFQFLHTFNSEFIEPHIPAVQILQWSNPGRIMVPLRGALRQFRVELAESNLPVASRSSVEHAGRAERTSPCFSLTGLCGI